MENNPYAQLEQDYYKNKGLMEQYFADQRKINEQQVNANTQNMIGQINQQKGYAQQDLNKEIGNAYTDYQKSINPYGVESEKIANLGLGGTGYSESSKVRNYNTYQNRATQAINTTSKIKADFDNKINEAMLTGNTQLAQIALQEYQSKIDMLSQELNFKTNLTNSRIAQNNWQTQFDYAKQQDALSQQNWQTQFDYAKQQDALSQANWEREYNLSNSKSYSSGSTPNSSIFSNTEYTTQANPTTNTTTSSINDFTGYDMNSILNLGYGPINRQTLENLISQGKVLKTIGQNGKIIVTRNPMKR